MEATPDQNWLSSRISFFCSTCGEPGDITSAKLKRAFGEVCECCIAREFYLSNLAEDPSKWGFTRQGAVSIISDAGFDLIDDAGEVLFGARAVDAVREVWIEVPVICRACSTKMKISAVEVMALEEGAAHCLTCVSPDMMDQINDVYSSHGLVRDHVGYARLSDPVAAHCMTCGSDRRVSFLGLLRGEPACLSCTSGIDPNAPHRVYLMHFPRFGVFKIGITNLEDRNYDRIHDHESHGGTVVEIVDVPNREAAFTVERAILATVTHYHSDVSRRQFPQGGWTETWRDHAPAVDLKATARELATQEAPGFDRRKHLDEYFAIHPIKVEELVSFVKATPVEIESGETVFVFGLTESREEMLRKVRKNREGG
ncbi:hypothetical protein [Actinoallomurus sp. CA-150999]|uniref:hypothetical protein n=1 Tax=Actinoallomurus sp. CA-150999 TaxID=3239887 RepID=UPI003D937DD2